MTDLVSLLAGLDAGERVRGRGFEGCALGRGYGDNFHPAQPSLLRRSLLSHRPSVDNEITVADGELGSLPQPVGHLGGRTRRKAPTAGLRPTVRFAVALALTLAWVGFSIWVSDPWRGELKLRSARSWPG